MIPALDLLTRSDGKENLGGTMRPPGELLSHRDRAALNDLYHCTSTTQVAFSSVNNTGSPAGVTSGENTLLL